MTGIIILAAGNSSRLGQPKQNLIFNGKTLLQHATDAALATECQPVIVVMGAFNHDIHFDAADERLIKIENPHWQQGMSSSIHAGLQQLLKSTPNIAETIIMLCDQPLVNAGLLSKMMEVKKGTNKNIVACAYNGTIGVPVLFTQHYFTHLMALQNEHGAKKLLSQYIHDVEVVDFESAKTDIDTREDYEALLQTQQQNQLNQS